MVNVCNYLAERMKLRSVTPWLIKEIYLYVYNFVEVEKMVVP